MSTPAMDNRTQSEEHDAASSLEAVGKKLAQKRSECGYSQEQLANQLHLGVEQLAALETGALDRLPEPVFIKAMVRRIGAHLGMDADAMVHSLGLSTQKPGPARRPSPPGPSPAADQLKPGVSSSLPDRQSRKPLIFLGLGLGIAAISVLVKTSPFDDVQWLQGSPQPIRAPQSVSENPPLEPAVPEPIPLGLETERSASIVLISSREPSWIALRRDGIVEFEGLLEGEREIVDPVDVEIYAGRPDLVMIEHSNAEPRALGTITEIRWMSLRPER